jgi:hypothetical protein
LEAAAAPASWLSQTQISSDRDTFEELLMCDASCSYFLHNYVRIYDAVLSDWVPFHLWPFQHQVLKTLEGNLLVIILKARQLGLTWLCLGRALWLMLFRPAATVLLFSKREEEAKHLLKRLTDMYDRLPSFIQKYAREVLTENTTAWILGNGSEARAFPTSAGDSYSATYVLADEFDLVEDQGHLMTSVKPTVDAGGQMVLLSRADKERPLTDFKNIYRAAKEKLNSWTAIFLPWQSRPDRTPEWYEAQRIDSITRTTALDDLYEQYPATDAEALAPPSLNKRIPVAWLQRCYHELTPLEHTYLTPAISELHLYKLPERGRSYVLGADPAEGNPTSDDSALDVLDFETGEQVATLAGKLQPEVLGQHIIEVARYYNKAQVLVERNNHGHAVLLWLTEHGQGITILEGTDSKAGWLTTQASKAMMFDMAAQAFREKDTILHNFPTFVQLSSIEAASNKAPEGEMDDKAISYSLGLLARTRRKPAPPIGQAVPFRVAQQPGQPFIPGRR